MSEENKEVVTEEIVTRLHPLTVISLMVYGDYEVHDIQQNTSWAKNPYGDSYALVPDSMVEAIMLTNGFCDIELNAEGTEVISFTAREIPTIPAQEEISEEEIFRAELLLSQAEIKLKQEEQDEVLAEILLNQMEG